MTLRRVPTRTLEKWVRDAKAQTIFKDFPDNKRFFMSDFLNLKELPDENGDERNMYTLAEIKAELERRYAIELERTI